MHISCYRTIKILWLLQPFPRIFPYNFRAFKICFFLLLYDNYIINFVLKVFFFNFDVYPFLFVHYLKMESRIIPILFRDLTDIYKRTCTRRYYKYYIVRSWYISRIFITRVLNFTCFHSLSDVLNDVFNPVKSFCI